MSDFPDLPGFIIPVIAILLPIGIMAVIGHFKNKEREMIHRERMLAMEKGLQPPADPGPSVFARREPGPRSYLLRGLVWLFVGLGAWSSMKMFPAFWVGRMLPAPLSWALMPFLAFIPAGVGVAFLIYYAIEASNPRPPAP
jgi:hypothetical protein